MFRQQQKQTTTYEKTTINNSFWQTIAWLEKYIEVAYPNYRIRKQIHNDNIKNNDPNKVESILAKLLFGLKTEITGKSTFFCDELKQEYYKWLEAAKIDINNCPERLKHFLFEFNEILERRGVKIASDELRKKNEIDLNFVEEKEAFGELFFSKQTPLENEKFKSLEGKNYEDIMFENIGGSGKIAEQAFKQMAEQHDYQGFHFFPQREYNPKYIQLCCINDPSEVVVESTNPQDWTNFQIIQDVKNNPSNWSLEEVVVRYYGEEKKVLLIHKTAQAIYDPERNLIFNNNPLYCLERFDAKQRFEIKQAKNISSNYLTDKEIKWAVREVKRNPSVWQFKEIDGQVYLIHNSAQIKQEEIGTLIHSQQKFSQAEIEEINKSLISYQEQKHLASLIKQRKETKDKIQGKIEEVIRFKTWWSNYNVATVINYHEGYYRVFVVVYEPAHKEMSEVLETFEIDNVYDDLESAKSKASSLRNDLNGENPILAIHPSTNSYTSFSEIIKDPYVVKVDLPYETKSRGESIAIPTLGSHRRHGISRRPRMFISVTEEVPNKNPDQYLKPLDVVWVKKAAFPGVHFHHVGIYLGNNQVCHIAGGKNDGRGIRIEDWGEFIKGYCVGGKVFGYHSIIPFKHYKTIAQQISLSTSRQWRENDYCLAGQNCEHAANMLKYGIEYSKQVEERPELAELSPGVKYDANKNKSGSFILKDEIKRVNNLLKQSDNSQSRQIEARIEILPKQDNCRIM